VLVGAFSIALYFVAGGIEAPTFYSSLTVDQMVNGWYDKAWTAIEAANEDETCNSGWEPIFTN